MAFPNRRFHDPRIVLEIVSSLSLPERLRILDLGCGNGLLTLDLARAFPHAEVLGLDPTVSQIGLARENHAKEPLGNVRFAVGNAASQMLPGSRFDLVVMLQVVQFMDHPPSEFRRIRKLLAPDGRVLFSTGVLPQEEPGRSFARRLTERFIGAKFWLSELEWRNLLAQAGFAVQSLRYDPWRLSEVSEARKAILHEELERTGFSLEQVQPWMVAGYFVVRAATQPG